VTDLPHDPELVSIEDAVAHPPEIGVYGAPRPAVPERLPLTPRHRGCGSGGPGSRAERRIRGRPTG
jgi:hypothetical protein